MAVAIHGDLFQDGEAAPLTRSRAVATQCDDDDDQHQRQQRQQAENEWQPSLHVSPPMVEISQPAGDGSLFFSIMHPVRGMTRIHDAEGLQECHTTDGMAVREGGSDIMR